MPVDRAPAPRPDPVDVVGSRSRIRRVAKVVLAIAELALSAMLYLVAASLVALLIVRVGSDWIDGTNPLAAAAERPRLYPQQIAMRELALDVLRQICLAGLVISIARWRTGPGWRGTLALGWRPGESWRLAPVTFGAILLVWPFLHIVWVTGTAEFFHAPFGRHVGLSPFLSTTATVVWLAYVAILAPIAEELLMRGAIFAKGLAPLGPAGIIVTSAILFSGAHVTPAGFARPVSLVPLALVLGWLRWRSGRLWPCILLHGWSNLAMVAYVLWPTDI